MQYREQCAKKTAVKMYPEGKDQPSIIKMLQVEGAGEKIIGFVEDYYKSYLFIYLKRQTETKNKNCRHVYHDWNCLYRGKHVMCYFAVFCTR